jgi:hypothetical protein
MLIAAAAFALQNKGLAGCTEPKSCNTIAHTRTSPAPAAHFHMHSEMTVSIYTQSSTLWFLPSLELKQITGSPDIILASDSRLPPPRPGRGHGAFQAGPFPVYVPTAHRLLEAFVRLVAGSHEGRYRYFGLAMITYIEEYVDADGLLEEARLGNRCREFYSELKSEQEADGAYA